MHIPEALLLLPVGLAPEAVDDSDPPAESVEDPAEVVLEDRAVTVI